MRYIEKKIIYKSIEKEVVRIVRRLGQDETIGLDEPLIDYFDSLDAVECIMEMERVFEIPIHDEDAESMTSIRECCAMLRNKYLTSIVDDRAEKLKQINDSK